MVSVADIDHVLAYAFRLPIRKALDPNDPQDFVLICDQLAKATKGLVGADEAKALKTALAHLDVDWKSMSTSAKDAVVNAAKAALNPTKLVLPKVQEHFEANAQALGKKTKGSAAKQFGFGISPDLNAVDKKILGAVAFSQGNFIRDEYGKRSEMFGLKAKKIVAEELGKGTGFKEIGARLHEELSAQQFNRSRAYWDMVASAFANRARTYANLSTFQEAGVTTYTFESVLDSRTSEVCRFMHGRRFSVQSAMNRFMATESNDDPESVKDEQPWLRVSGGQIWYPSGDDRVRVADVVKPGAGKEDEVGAYARGMSDQKLAMRGIMMPPLHGRCRSTILPDVTEPRTISVPFALRPSGEQAPPTPAPPPVAAPVPEEQGAFSFGPGGISLKPLEVKPLAPETLPAPPFTAPTPPLPAPPPAVTVYTPPASTPKAQALADLQHLIEKFGNAAGNVTTPMPVFSATNLLAGKHDLIQEALTDPTLAKWKTAKKGVETPGVKVMNGTFDPQQVDAFIKNPKLLKQADVKAVMVGHVKLGPGKYQKQFVVVEGHEAMVAAKLLGKDILPMQIADLKEIEKASKAKALAGIDSAKAPPPPAPKPPIPGVTPPVKPGEAVDPENILHQKTGAAAGNSSKDPRAGFYMGKDGVARYVKVYDDPIQAHGEVLANSLYKALGFESPESVTWKDPSGKQFYAAKLLDGATFEKGYTKDQAREFMRGFVADVMSANWDAAGMSADNAFLLKNGKVARIDNGGAFLVRAQGGKKPDKLLNSIAEWDGFFPGSGIDNPGYHAIAKKAGYTSPDDFKEVVKQEFGKVQALRSKFGGWSNFVDQYAPGLPPAERARVVEMMEARHSALEKKIGEWNQKKPPVKQPEPSGDFWRAPGLGGVAPSKSLKFEDVPAKRPPVEGWDQEKVPRGLMPWGTETHAGYLKRVDQKMKNISPASKRAINDFTGAAYGPIRDAELAEARGRSGGKYLQKSKDIQKAYKDCQAEPVTVWRGITVTRDAALKMMQEDGVFRLGIGNTPATSSSSHHIGVAVQHFMGGDGDPWDPDRMKVLFQIHQKSGIPIERISKFNDKGSQNEGEILLPKDAQFRVVSVAKWEGRKRVLIIELEEI